MRYIWRAAKGSERRVMHIARFTQAGELLMDSLCRINPGFNRSINAPFALGRPICRRCRKVLDHA